MRHTQALRGCRSGFGPAAAALVVFVLLLWGAGVDGANPAAHAAHVPTVAHADLSPTTDVGDDQLDRDDNDDTKFVAASCLRSLTSRTVLPPARWYVRSFRMPSLRAFILPVSGRGPPRRS